MRVALHFPALSVYDGAVTSLCRAGIRVTSYPDVAALCAGLAAGLLPDAVVTGLRDACGRPVTAGLGRIRSRFPAVPVVAYGVLAPSLAEDLLAAARHGLAAAVFHGVEDLAAVLRRVVAGASTG